MWATPNRDDLDAPFVLQVWEYLDATCRETAALAVDLNLTSPNGHSIAHTKVYAWGMTGDN